MAASRSVLIPGSARVMASSDIPDSSAELRALDSSSLPKAMDTKWVVVTSCRNGASVVDIAIDQGGIDVVASDASSISRPKDLKAILKRGSVVKSNRVSEPPNASSFAAAYRTLFELMAVDRSKGT